jgi:hypothetical protein
MSIFHQHCKGGVRVRRHLIPIHRKGFLRFLLLKRKSKVFINTQIIKGQQEPRGKGIEVSQKEVLKYISDVTQKWFPAIFVLKKRAKFLYIHTYTRTWQQEPKGRDIYA